MLRADPLGLAGVGGGGRDVGGGLSFGGGDLAFGHHAAALDVLFQLDLGVRQQARGVVLGGGDHAGRGLLGRLALDLDVGQQALGLLAKLVGLVELGLDLLPARIQDPGDGAGNLGVDHQAREEHEGQADPEFGVPDELCDEVHGALLRRAGAERRC